MPDPSIEDFQGPPPRVEPTPRWIRVRAGATEVADSRRALLLVWFGPAMLPTYCLPAGDVRTELLRPSGTPAGHPFLANHDVVAGERHVRVELDGEVVAESSRPHALFETTLPTRWYLPPEDVLQELLVPSDTVSRCPYKGTATYWSVRTRAGLHPDVAWSYPEPVLECPRIAGLVAFFNEKVDLVVDGVPQERPRSPWS